MKYFRIVYKYLLHFFSARNSGGFGVHSPFMFQFTHFVLKEKHPFYVFETIEMIRSKLKKDNRVLNITDFGTGKDRSLTVATVASKSLKSDKYGKLLFRITYYLKARQVLELGTSLGITTSYLASSHSDINCISLEGCPQIANVARDNFNKLGLNNIKLVVGDINLTLAKVLEETDRLDLVFFDANHRSETVLRYFEQCLPKIHKNTVFIIDDIYWSEDMEKAWKLIKQHSSVTSTIDLFQLGIVFFNTDLYKKHYKMRY